MNRNGLTPTLLLNSTHGRYPLGSDSWVRATAAALDSLDPGGHVLITSVGLANWELTAHLAAVKGFPQLVALPGEDDGAGRRYYERCLDELGLEEQLTSPLFAGKCDSRSFRAIRDRLAFETAELVYPVSVRPGGRLDTLLREFAAAGGRVSDDFRVEYAAGGWRPGYRFDSAPLNPALREFSSGWLTHWTHSRPGPWPGEKPASFYSGMLATPDLYVRSAGATLARIISDQVIRGSSLHMSGGAMMVSLTGLPVSEALPLMRWRSRWRRWSMEPFGISFRREALVRLGARRVSYHDDIPADLAQGERKFSQRRGRVTDWRGEREWRLSGDLPLGAVAADQIAVLVYDKNWLELCPRLTGRYRIVPLLAEKD